MKLKFVSVVAAFLLCSVIAERNGPTNILTPRRRFDKSFGENETRRISSGGRSIASIRNGSPSRATGISKTAKTPMGKFPGMMPPKKPDIRLSRKFSPAKFHQPRRSLRLGIDFGHPPVPKIIHDVVLMEPVIYKELKKSFFGHSIGTDFGHDSNEILGPLIGPLNFPGIGSNVHIRLIVPPHEEAASHVTVHLVNKSPVKILTDIHHSADFAPPARIPKALLIPAEESMSLALVPPRQSPANSPGIRPMQHKPVHNPSFTPSKVESALGHFRVKNQPMVPPQIAKDQPAAEFGDPGQYFAAPNHHQLPVAHRPADSLTNLPIYPPLSPHVFKDDIGSGGNRVNVSAEMDDTQQSASSKRALVSRNYPPFKTGYPKHEETSNRRETPEPVFMPEIPPPDLSSADKVFSTRFSTVSPQDGMDYFSRHTTTSRTGYLYPRHTRPGGLNSNDNYGKIRSTTSKAVVTETRSKNLDKKRGSSSLL